MDEPYLSDPEDILDQQELEVALYSQVHFDPGPGSESWNEKTENILSLSNRRPFHIEVKSLTAKISAAKPSQPSPTGDFIAFTENPSKKCKEGKRKKNVDSVASCSNTKLSPQTQKSPKDTKSSLAFPALFEIDKKGASKSSQVEAEEIINKDEVSQDIENKKSLSRIKSPVSNKKVKKNSNAQSDIINSIDTKSKTTKEKVKPVVSAETVKESSKDVHSSSSSTVADKFLPFKMTKTNFGRSKEIPPEHDSSNEQLNKTLEDTGKQTKGFPKLDDFLHLSKSDNNKAGSKGKKKVTKLDAAVQIRKPTVCVRRPPVIVKYKQDSDTNTDYSDSECSNLASPVKAFTKTTARKQETSSNRADSNKSIQPNVSTTELEKDEDSSLESGECILVKDGASSDDTNAEEIIEDSSSQVSTEDESSSGEIVSSSGEIVSSSGEIVSSSSSSSEEDGPLDVTPNLEFNIEGGISALLSASPSPADGDWKIDQQDRFKNKSVSNRYFSPFKVQCRNCRVEGHLSRDCPKPLKKKCVFCAQEGHICLACPDAVCFNCDTPGHRNTDCPEPRRNRNIPCRRCLVYGHGEELCPDRWRQYHISTDPKHINTQSETATNDRVYCYNCAAKGHFGHDCKAPRMNRFVPASYPLIVRYDQRQNHRWHIKEKNREHEDDKSGGKWKRKHSRTDADRDSSKKSKRSPKKAKKKDKETTEKPESDLSAHTSDKRHKKQNSRKRQFENDSEALEDFVNHQVHDNEWWNSQPARKRAKRGNQSEDYYNDNDWQGRRESDRGNHFRGPQSDFNQNPLWEREYRQMGRPGPGQMGRPGPGQIARPSPGQRGRPGPGQMGRPSPGQMGRPSPGQMGQPSPRQMPRPGPRQAQFMMGENAQRASPLFPEPRGFSRPGNRPSPRGMNHSQSWPSMVRPKNKGGFGFQNRDFAMMKNNVDRSNYQANW